jgi:hypothetical protein
VPPDYVITPFGYFHPSCVLELKKGEYMRDDGVLHRPDGSSLQFGPCRYPHFRPSGEPVNGTKRAHNTTVEQSPEAPPEIGHSWIESSWVNTNTSYGEEVSNWTVPPAPLTQDGQTVYFFPGFEGVGGDDTILQPVIGWFGGEWTAASWNCCVSGTAEHSALIKVNPGDAILGTMVMTCAAGTTNCASWDITTLDQTLNESTELSNSSSEGETYNWATGGALEVYNIAQCLDYPPNASLTITSQLYDVNMTLISDPNWTVQNYFLNSNPPLQPQCNYGVKTTATTTTLTYGTTGPGFGLGVEPAAGIAVNQGSSASATVTITDINGFNGAVDVAASNLPTGITAQLSQGTSFNSYTLTLTASSTAALTGANTPAAMTLTASGSGVSTQTFPVNVLVNPPLAGGTGIVVDLTAAYNVNGFCNDSNCISVFNSGSIDNSGDIYSFNQLDPPDTNPLVLDVNGTRFSFGQANQKDAVYGTGANPISLPSGHFNGLQILASGVGGSQYSPLVQVSQTIIVTYADTTTQTFTQTFDNWYGGASCTTWNPCAAGESVAVTLPYIEIDSTLYPRYDGIYYLYAYTFALDSSKAVESLTLPNNRDVVMLAATLTGGTSIPSVVVEPDASSISATQSLQVTVTVSGGSGNPTPTGSVTLTGGGYTSSAATLTSGSATFNIPAGSLATGSDTLTVTYTPDSNSSSTYNTATGTSSTVTVGPAKTTPTLTVTPSATSITTAQPLTVTVVVSDGAGNPTPTGSVTLTSGTYSSASTPLSGGSTTITVSPGALAAGADTLTATYTPDSNSSSTYNIATGTSSVTVTNAPPFGSLDWAGDQKNTATTIPVSDVLAVVGWAADVKDGAPVKQVEITIDGSAVGNASLGSARPDVAAAYNNSSYLNSGWSFVYSASYMAAGTHTVSAVAFDSLGLSTTIGTKTFTVTGNAPPFGNLDWAGDQKNGATTIPSADVLAVVGWAADGTDGAPVKQVQVSIDGSLVGSASLGSARADVAAAFGARFINSGWSFVYAASYMAAGTHTVSAVAFDSLGNQTLLGSKTFTITGNAPPFGNLDWAGDQKNGATTIPSADVLAVVGWAADGTDGAPVKQVQVLIDGSLVGAASLGSARADVAAAFGARFTNAGWSFVY